MGLKGIRGYYYVAMSINKISKSSRWLSSPESGQVGLALLVMFASGLFAWITYPRAVFVVLAGFSMFGMYATWHILVRLYRTDHDLIDAKVHAETYAKAVYRDRTPAGVVLMRDEGATYVIAVVYDFVSARQASFYLVVSVNKETGMARRVADSEEKGYRLNVGK